MKKIIILGSVIVLLIGLLLYAKTNKYSMKKEVSDTTSQKVLVSPLFGYLSAWLPAAVWDKPKQSTRQTSYGELSGMVSEGKLVSKGATINRNYESVNVMKNLGFVEDINLAADGPGASNWGYRKTENGKTRIAIFSYSTGALRGPEMTESPNEISTIYLSLFVSDLFTK